MLNVVKDKGFLDSDIKILRDDSPETAKPNYHNVMNAFSWLSENRSPRDALFVHFSGHVG